jgi:hypothetical protein
MLTTTTNRQETSKPTSDTASAETNTRITYLGPERSPSAERH